MPGGPIAPSSAFPVDVGCYPTFYVGAGGNAKQTYGLGFIAGPSTDITWRLQFPMPPVLPSGTGKLLIYSLANVGSAQNALVDPQWVCVGDGDDPSTATLVAETDQTIAWGAGDADNIMVDKITLDASTIVAGELLVMDLVRSGTEGGDTLSVEHVFQPFIIWE